MSEVDQDLAAEDPAQDGLLGRIERLERENQEYRAQSDRKVLLSEMKVHALRAGMIDLDGLAFLNLENVQFSGEGDIPEAAVMIGRLKQSKPWLFAQTSSSSVSRTPQSKATQFKRATDMSDEEYRLARANIIRRSTS